MAQQQRALTALLEDLGSIPSTRVVSITKGSDAFFWLRQVPIYMQKKFHIHIIKQQYI